MRRTHTLYISSKYRNSGTPSNYTVALPQVLNADPNMELCRISLKNFTTYNSWFIVKQGANTIRMNSTPYIVPEGNYTYQRLAKTIEALFQDTTVQWIQEQNKVRFSFPSSRSLIFDDLGTTLGFTPNQVYTGSVITSPFPMLPYSDPHLFIHLNNISPTAEHLVLSNHTGELRVSNILAKVLINASPFQLITHQQVLESDGIITGDETLNSLEVFITDSEGNEFVDMPNHDLVLTIEYMDVEDFDAKDTIEELRAIKSWVKDLVVMKTLNHRKY